MTEKFKTYTQDGVTLSMWSYDSLLTNTRQTAFLDQFDLDSPLFNTQAFQGFYALCTTVNAIEFANGIEKAWPIAFKAWWERAAPLIKTMRFDEAWELFGEIDGECHKDIYVSLLLGWHQTRRDYIPASEVVSVEAAKSKDPDFLAVEKPVSRRLKKNT